MKIRIQRQVGLEREAKLIILLKFHHKFSILIGLETNLILLW